METLLLPAPSHRDVCYCLAGLHLLGQCTWMPDTHEDFVAYLTGTGKHVKFHGTPKVLATRTVDFVYQTHDLVHLVTCGAERCRDNQAAIRRFWELYVELAEDGYTKKPTRWPDGLEPEPYVGEALVLEHNSPVRKAGLRMRTPVWVLRRSTCSVAEKTFYTADVSSIKWIAIDRAVELNLPLVIFRGDGKLRKIMTVETLSQRGSKGPQSEQPTQPCNQPAIPNSTAETSPS